MSGAAATPQASAKRIVTAARKVVLDHSATLVTLVLCGIAAGGC